MSDHLAVYGGSRCLEIGAGMGRTAYYAKKFGIPNYTIIDLPIALVGQACFLAATIGEDSIVMFREDGHGIRLMPPQWMDNISAKFDILLNVDSLTEMSIGYAKKYIGFVEPTAECSCPSIMRPTTSPQEKSHRT